MEIIIEQDQIGRFRHEMKWDKNKLLRKGNWKKEKKETKKEMDRRVRIAAKK